MVPWGKEHEDRELGLQQSFDSGRTSQKWFSGVSMISTAG